MPGADEDEDEDKRKKQGGAEAKPDEKGGAKTPSAQSVLTCA